MWRTLCPSDAHETTATRPSPDNPAPVTHLMIQTGAPEETGMGPLPFSADYSAISPHGIANTRLAGLGTWEAQRQAYARFYAMVLSQGQLIIDTARAKGFATIFPEQSLVAKGALASYGQSYYEIGPLSAKYVQKVLSGTNPRDLRIETFDDVELVIKTAKELGLTIPPNVLARANKVIK